MKTGKTTEAKIVEVSYWTCHCENHRHKKREYAQSCIYKSEKPVRVLNHWTEEKYKEVLDKWRKNDITKAELGREYNVNAERIRQIIAKAERIERKNECVLIVWQIGTLSA